MVINLAYEGTLKSHLTVLIEPKPIETLHDFAVQTKGDIIYVSELNALRDTLESSPIDKVRTLMDDRNVLARKTSFDEFYKEPLEGKSIISSNTIFQYEIKRLLTNPDGSVDVQVVPQLISNYPVVCRTCAVTNTENNNVNVENENGIDDSVVFFAPRTNKFIKLINKRTIQLIENGLTMEILKRVVDNVESTFTSVTHSTKGQFKTPKLDDFRALFVGFVFGVVFAGICFLIEKMYTKM